MEVYGGSDSKKKQVFPQTEQQNDCPSIQRSIAINAHEANSKMRIKLFIQVGFTYSKYWDLNVKEGMFNSRKLNVHLQHGVKD